MSHPIIITLDVLERARHLAHAGLSLPETAERLGVKVGTLANAASRFAKNGTIAPIHWRRTSHRSFEIEMVGKRFGRLSVIRQAPVSKRQRRWICSCECGNETVVIGAHLTNGHTTSCGCFKMQRISETKTTHGKRNSRAYASWTMMIQRATNPKMSRWKDWGGRGITVCDEWRDFAQFYADMGDCPEGRSIERVDNERGYEPGNCRWATDVEQARNTRITQRITLCGKEIALRDACDLFGIKITQISHKAKWWSVSKTEAFYWVLERSMPHV
jgi:hypothetical protein